MFKKLKARGFDPQSFLPPLDPRGEKTEIQLLSTGLIEIAGCRGLLVYTDTEIGMEILEGRLYINGSALELKLYRGRHIAVIGQISSLRFEEGRRGAL